MIPASELEGTGDGAPEGSIPGGSQGRPRPPGSQSTQRGLLRVYNANITQVYQGILSPDKSTTTYKTPRTSINPDQPFIYVGPGTNNRTPGVFKGDGGAFLSTANAKDDVRLLPFGVSFARDNNRIIKFLRSPDGLRFVAKQATLQAFNPYDRTKVFNPAAILASTVPGVHAARFIDTQALTGFRTGIREGLSQFGNSLLNTGTTFVGNTELGQYGDNGYFTNADSQRAIGGNRYADFLREEFSSLTSLGKPKKKSNIKDPMNSRGVYSVNNNSTFTVNYDFLQTTRAVPANENTTTETDIITFRFSGFGGEQVDELKYIPFRAFISSLTENVKPEYNEQRYVGRTERFITYAGVKREIALAFNIVAFSQSEIEHAWTRVNYLTGLAFPKGISQTGFIQPQLFRITIGGIYNDQPCYIQSLDYDFIDDKITFDTRPGVEVPQTINVKMQLSLIEKTTKYYNSPFYKIMEDVANNQKDRADRADSAINQTLQRNLLNPTPFSPTGETPSSRLRSPGPISRTANIRTDVPLPTFRP